MKTPDPLLVKFPFYPLLNIEGERNPLADEILCTAIARLQTAAAEPARLCNWINAVKYRFEDIPQRGLTCRGLVRLNPKGMTEWTVVHELAHAWDASQNWQISARMRKVTHSRFTCRWLHKHNPENPRFWYHVGCPPAPCGIDKNFNEKEDFAESVTAYLFPDEAHRRASKRGYSYEVNGFTHFHATPRGVFIKNLFVQ